MQSARRQVLLTELRALRRDMDERSSPDHIHSLDAALLLLEFMGRAEEVATAETLQIVASLVSTIDERALRTLSPHAVQADPASPDPDVTAHADLRLTHEYLLGSILLQASVISPESLSRALQLHTSSGLALGQCLIQLGAASSEQIAGAVAYQDRLREEERSTRSEPERAPTRLELKMSPQQRGFVQSMHAQVLGEVLVRQGAITRAQLERGLQLQRAANVHIGEALVQSGATSWEHIKRALEAQRQLRRSVA
ncbi:MAG: hypothetical protein EXS08_05780 [Planctomycetes bacterium]|nr:hypothetical protein [Planctomycetota bacterium]